MLMCVASVSTTLMQSLQDVLKKAETYVKTLETDQVLRGESVNESGNFGAVHKMSASYQKGKASRKSTGDTRRGRWKSCPQCFAKHEKADCPFTTASCYKCGKKGHIQAVCKLERTKRRQRVSTAFFKGTLRWSC